MARTELTPTEQEIIILAAAYPNAKIPGDTITVYVADLADLPDDVLHAACIECRASCKWFPTIAEIRTAAARIQVDALQLPPALEAWGTMWKEINGSKYHPDLAANGDPTRPAFSNPITARIVDSMGLRYLYTSENGMSDRSQFIKAYEEYERRGVKELASPPALVPGSARVSEQLAGLAKRLSAPAERKQ